MRKGRQLCIWLSIFVLLSGCKKNVTTDVNYISEEKITETEVSNGKTSTLDEGDELKTESKNNEHVNNEIMKEESKLTIDEWITSLNLTEMKIGVWNEKNGEGKIFEQEEVYRLNDGDKVFIFKAEGIESMALYPKGVLESVEVHDSYNIWNMQFEEFAECDFDIYTKNGNEYKFIFTLINENCDYKVTSTGDEWVNSLTYDEPKLVVWNNETGKKEELENGTTYQLEENDRVAIYYTPENYSLHELYPKDFYINYGEKFVAIDFSGKQVTEETKFEFCLIDVDNLNEVIYEITLLPIK